MKFYLEVEIDPSDIGFIDLAEWLREVRDKGSELGRVLRAEMQGVPETINLEPAGRP